MAFNRFQSSTLSFIAISLLTITLSGCGSLRYWWQNDRLVGPNYQKPTAQVAENWNAMDSIKLDPSNDPEPCWWDQFGDPNLSLIVEQVRSQNLSLKVACERIREARYQRNIAAANLFPQNQSFNGQFAHTQNSVNSGTAFPGVPLTVDDWSIGFDASWELDLWGKIRRNVYAADAQVCERIHDYHFAQVTLIADAASLYIQIRSLDERIELARKNVELQEGSLDIAEKRFKEGRTDKIDVTQAESNLAATRSLIPQLELSRRQFLNALCVLLALPPSEIPHLSELPGKIPEIPPSVVVGIPADLLCRRPDLMAAERQMAAQFQQIGIAEADLYPAFGINGTLGWQAARLSDLFESPSFNGTIAPGFSWKILNFGRLKQAICIEKSRFRQILMDYQNSVLLAQQEVEDGIVEFVKKSEQLKFDTQNAEANAESVELSIASFKAGKSDFSRVFVVQSGLVTAQDQVVRTRACIALALIKTYRALGGGWQCHGFHSNSDFVYKNIHASEESDESTVTFQIIDGQQESAPIDLQSSEVLDSLFESSNEH